MPGCSRVLAQLVVLLCVAVVVTVALGGLGNIVCSMVLSVVMLIALATLATRRAKPAGLRSLAGPCDRGSGRCARLLWLDNLKVVLTALVVIHHATGCFVGSGWVYSLAAYRNPFEVFGTGVMALNQSYFMCLFFFVSAYLTPASLKRKGAEAFLYDRFTRLGVPFYAVTLVMMPLHNAVLAICVVGERYTYFPDPGPAWFLAWLLIFNCSYVLLVRESDRRREALALAYAHADQPTPAAAAAVPTMVRPGLGWLILLSVPTGAVMAVLCVVTGPSLLVMPMSTGALLFDMAMFVGGILAKEHGWLQPPPAAPAAAPAAGTHAMGSAGADLSGGRDVGSTVGRDVGSTVGGEVIRGDDHAEGEGTMSRLHGKAEYKGGSLPLVPAVVLTGAMSAGVFGALSWYYVTDQTFMSGTAFARVGANNTMEAASTEVSSERVCGLFFYFIYFGVATPVISIAMLAVFQRWANFTNRTTKVLSSAAYTVYLVHPLMVSSLTFAYTQILQSCAGVTFEYAYPTANATRRIATSGTDFGSDERVFLGWLFVVVGSLTAVWPFAHYFRQLPFVNRIL